MLIGTQPYDVFLCCAEKDYVKLPFVVRQIKQNLTGFDRIAICSPTSLSFKLPYDRVDYYRDTEVLDIDRRKLRVRPNWIHQQLLKMFQKVTPHEYYLTVDCDILIMQKLPVFSDEGKPIWYYVSDQNHSPYFVFQNKVMGFGKVWEHSFIADMNFFNKSLVSEMLQTHGYTEESFIQKCVEVLSPNCYIAEPEIYGSYVHLKHPGLYEYRFLRTTCSGRHQSLKTEVMYTESDVEAMCAHFRAEGVALGSIHSWYAESPYNV